MRKLIIAVSVLVSVTSGGSVEAQESRPTCIRPQGTSAADPLYRSMCGILVRTNEELTGAQLNSAEDDEEAEDDDSDNGSELSSVSVRTEKTLSRGTAAFYNKTYFSSCKKIRGEVERRIGAINNAAASELRTIDFAARQGRMLPAAAQQARRSLAAEVLAKKEQLVSRMVSVVSVNETACSYGM